METLQTNGYIIFRNILNSLEIQQGETCFDGNKIHYTRLRNFIDDSMMTVLQGKLGWVSPKYVKYRASNNNNSDAGAFHRDIIPHKENLTPIFTCLTYFDKTTMELIPGTHLKHSGSLAEACVWYRKKERIVIHPGDVLLFYSTLLHRGIFTEPLPNRRLIQVFEVFPCEQDYREYASQICHVLGHESDQPWMSQAFRMPVIASLFNWIGYLNAFTGYGNDYFHGPFCMSSEGFRCRLTVVPNAWQEGNRYILCDKTFDLESKYERLFHWNYYNRQYVLHTMCMLLLLYLIVVIAKRIVTGA